MRLALVAMPWSMLDRPSPAVAALASFLRSDSRWSVSSFYEYVNAARAVGVRLYEILAAYQTGDLAYLAVLHEGKARDDAVERLAASAVAAIEDSVECGVRACNPLLPSSPEELLRACHSLVQTLETHVDEVVERLLGYDLVGMTTCFQQLFANIAVARRLKSRSPATRIVLGGSSVSSEVGPSILECYECIDYVIQGEGELPLRALASHIADGDSAGIANIKGLLCRANAARLPRGAELWQVPDLDDLPLPDFSPYAQAVDELGVPWLPTIEGSRGCWWDRVRSTGRADCVCYFCNRNIQWDGYREKSVARLVHEVKSHVEKHKRTDLFFVDNILRPRGVLEMARALEELPLHLRIFYEVRANVSPEELAALRRAGADEVQIGIEGLSTPYLRRLGKGTTCIQNLQTLRSCYELRLTAAGNLITDFPGATAQEVDETWTNLTEFAICYEPLNSNPYHLGLGSTVWSLRERFPINRPRNKDIFDGLLPEKLRLIDLSFDVTGDAADWRDIVTFCRIWHRARGGDARFSPVLYYCEGGSFLRLVDTRGLLAEYFEGASLTRSLEFLRSLPPVREFLIEGAQADVYRYCYRARSEGDIVSRFASCGVSAHEVRELLGRWVDLRIMYREDSRYLSLATATRPDYVGGASSARA